MDDASFHEQLDDGWGARRSAARDWHDSHFYNTTVRR